MGQILLLDRYSLAEVPITRYVSATFKTSLRASWRGIILCQWPAEYGWLMVPMIVTEMAKRLNFFLHHIENR